MRTLFWIILGAGSLSAATAGAAADVAPPPGVTPSGEPAKDAPVDLSKIDKSGYTLWNPTPRKFLREMNALFDSPYTVDAGHVQTETYVLDYAVDHDRSGGADVRTKYWSFASTTLKLGVLKNLDVELDIAPYTHVRTSDRVARTVTTQSGFGDLTPKVKLNVCGNDGGRFALALMPYVKFPTNQDGLGNHAVEGGLVVPIAVELPKDWWLFLGPEVSFLKDSAGSGYSPAFANTAFLWHQIVGNLSGYVEFSSWVSAESSSSWIGTVDFGLTHMLTPNIQLDAGVYIGVTSAAPDIEPFLGVSFRF